MRQQDVRLLIQVGVSVVVLYAALGLFAGPDLDHFLFPWLAHIRQAGPIAAFSAPYSNYTPAYLYLLTSVSVLGLSPLVTVKLLSVLGTLWLALTVRQLLIALGSERHDEAALLSLLLPTVILNGPFLGQCDAIWVGCCLIAVAAAVEKRILAMAAWAGLGFAFKAQALFLAPFALALVIRERKWAALLIPPLAYLLAVGPAWMAGWPLDNLLTIYTRQVGYTHWLSTAPNLWALPAIFYPTGTALLTGLAYTLAVVAAALFVWRFPRRSLLAAALFSAILVPWLLPKMHERYFLLADLLSFCLAYVDRRGIPIFLTVQAGSLLSLFAYGTTFDALNVAGSVSMTAGLVLTGRLLFGRQVGDPTGAAVVTDRKPIASGSR